MRNQPHEINYQHVKKQIPSLRPNKSTDIKKWQAEARKQLVSLLGLPLTHCDLQFTQIYAEDRGDFIEYRFTVQTEPGYILPCHLWRPKLEGKLPVMICLQGHATGMHISMARPKFPEDKESIEGDRDFGVQCIREGLCALIIEQRNFGECGSNEDGSPKCYESAMTALLTGRTTIGERVWDISRAIDAVLSNFDFADDARIYCMGNSGGGTATTYATAIDTRIAASMPSCAICTYRDSIAAMNHCACNYVPNIARYFDMAELVGLIAPRPCVIVCGEKDDIFPLDGVKESYDIAKRYYEKLGAPDALRLVIGRGGHRFYAADAWPVFNSLTK